MVFDRHSHLKQPDYPSPGRADDHRKGIDAAHLDPAWPRLPHFPRANDGWMTDVAIFFLFAHLMGIRRASRLPLQFQYVTTHFQRGLGRSMENDLALPVWRGT